MIRLAASAAVVLEPPSLFHTAARRTMALAIERGLLAIALAALCALSVWQSYSFNYTVRRSKIWRAIPEHLPTNLGLTVGEFFSSFSSMRIMLIRAAQTLTGR